MQNNQDEPLSVNLEWFPMITHKQKVNYFWGALETLENGIGNIGK